jgi:type IV secretory pathway VirB10-like protein
MAGAAAAAPPVSEHSAVVDVERPAVGGNVSAGVQLDAVPVPPPATEQAAPPPPQKTFEELVVSADSVIGLRIESGLSSEVARVEDPVEARVTRDVRVGTSVAIPSGTRVIGSVIQVERGGKMKTAARIGVRFHTLVMADGNRLSMDSEAIYREGRSPGQESAAKVGAAAMGGAILGAIIGGGKGAAIGGAVGAAGGTGAVMAGGRNPAVISAGTSVTVRLRQPVTVTIEREEFRD